MEKIYRTIKKRKRNKAKAGAAILISDTEALQARVGSLQNDKGDNYQKRHKNS